MTVIGRHARKTGDFAALLNSSGGFRCRAITCLPEQAPRSLPKQTQVAFLFPEVDFHMTSSLIVALRPRTRSLLLLDDLGVSRLVLLSALEAGADGIIAWPCSVHEVWRVLAVIEHGGTPLPPELTTLLLDRLRQGRQVNPDWHRLTPREARVMAAVADGLSYKLVAERLGITVGTVQNHLNHVFAKLGVHSCTSALAKLYGTATTEGSTDAAVKLVNRRP